MIQWRPVIGDIVALYSTRHLNGSAEASKALEDGRIRGPLQRTPGAYNGYTRIFVAESMLQYINARSVRRDIRPSWAPRDKEFCSVEAHYSEIKLVRTAKQAESEAQMRGRDVTPSLEVSSSAAPRGTAATYSMSLDDDSDDATSRARGEQISSEAAVDLLRLTGQQLAQATSQHGLDKMASRLLREMDAADGDAAEDLVERLRKSTGIGNKSAYVTKAARATLTDAEQRGRVNDVAEDDHGDQQWRSDGSGAAQRWEDHSGPSATEQRPQEEWREDGTGWCDQGSAGGEWPDDAAEEEENEEKKRRLPLVWQSWWRCEISGSI